jgi:thiol-disulfide isomerase/thioredoxin
MMAEKFSFVYITSTNCNVCKVLAPKLEKLAAGFAHAKFDRINIDENPLAKGQFTAFAIPTLLVYSKSQELLRASRYINLPELTNKLERYHQMIFS